MTSRYLPDQDAFLRPPDRPEAPPSPTEEAAFDPRSILMPSFLVGAPGGGAGRDRNTLSTLFNQALEYTPIGDLRDVYEISQMLATPSSKLPAGMVGGTLGMLGLVMVGGRSAGIRGIQQLAFDPSIEITEHVGSEISNPLPATFARAEDLVPTEYGYQSQILHDSDPLPHRSIARGGGMGGVLATQMGTAMTSDDLAAYETWRMNQIEGRSVFDQDAVDADFPPTSPSDVNFEAGTRLEASLQARFLQQMYGTALYSRNVDELADHLALADVVRMHVAPELDEVQLTHRSAILQSYVEGADPTAISPFYVDQAFQTAKGPISPQQAEAAAGWFVAKVRLAKMASAIDQRVVYGDKGGRTAQLWQSWADGHMEIGTEESREFVDHLVELGRLTDWLPHTDPSISWDNHSRVLGFEMNADQPSTIILGGYQLPSYDAERRRTTYGLAEGEDSRPIFQVRTDQAAPATTEGQRERAKPKKTGTVSYKGGVGFALDNLFVEDTNLPEKGNTRLRRGTRFILPDDMTMSGTRAKAMSADAYGNLKRLMDDAMGQIGELSRFHHTVREVRATPGGAYTLRQLIDGAEETGGVTADTLADVRFSEIAPMITNLGPKGLPAPALTASIDAAGDRVHLLQEGETVPIKLTINEDGSFAASAEDLDLLTLVQHRESRLLKEEGVNLPRSAAITVSFTNPELLERTSVDLDRAISYTPVGQVEQINGQAMVSDMGYPARQMISQYSYRIVYPTIINWVAVKTGYTPFQVQHVFGFYGNNTDLNHDNIPGTIAHALGWTRINPDGLLEIPIAAGELTSMMTTLESNQFTEPRQLQDHLVRELEAWYQRWQASAGKWQRARNKGKADEGWFSVNPEGAFKRFSMKGVDVSSAQAMLDADPVTMNQLVDLYDQFLSTEGLASQLVDLKADAEAAGKAVTINFGVEPGETVRSRREMLSTSEVFKPMTSTPDYSITYDPATGTYTANKGLDGEKIRTFGIEVGPDLPTSVSVPFDPATIPTDIVRTSGEEVNLAHLMDVIESLNTAEGRRLTRAVVMDTHMHLASMGLAPTVGSGIGKEKFLPGKPFGQSQFADAVAYRSLVTSLLNLRISEPKFQTASDLQSFLWYPWRILTGQGQRGFAVNPHTVHTLQGRTNNATLLNALRRVTPTSAVIQDLELTVRQRSEMSHVIRMTGDQNEAALYVPVSDMTRWSHFRPLHNSTVTMTVRKENGEVAGTERWVPLVPRTPRRVGNIEAAIDNAMAGVTDVALTDLEGDSPQAEMNRLRESHYEWVQNYRNNWWFGYRQEAGFYQSWIRNANPFWQQWGARAEPQSKGWNENDLRALFFRDKTGKYNPKAGLQARALTADVGKRMDAENSGWVLSQINQRDLRKAHADVYRLTQESLLRMGAPEQMVVWRMDTSVEDEFTLKVDRLQAMATEAAEQGDDRRQKALDAFMEEVVVPAREQRAKAESQIPRSFALVPPSSSFAQAEPYLINRSDILIDTLAIGEGTHMAGRERGYWVNENEVMAFVGDATPLDPVQFLTSTASAGGYALTRQTSRHADRVAQPGDAYRHVEVVVPSEQPATVLAYADQIAAMITDGIVDVDYEYVNVQETEWYIPPPEQVASANWKILDPALGFDWQGEGEQASKMPSLIADLLVARPDQAPKILAEISDLMQAEKQTIGYGADPALVEATGGLDAAGSLGQWRNTVRQTMEGHAAKGDPRGTWTSSKHIAQLDALLGGVMPKRTAKVKKMALTFTPSTSVAAEELLRIFHSPVGAYLADVDVTQMTPADTFLPKTSDDGAHEIGHRVIDVFGENDPHLGLYSADPHDDIAHYDTALVDMGVHPDYLFTPTYEFQAHDGIRTGSVFMRHADTRDPHIVPVLMPRSRVLRIEGSANTHISDEILPDIEGNGWVWGSGEVYLDAESMAFTQSHIAADDVIPEDVIIGRTRTIMDEDDPTLLGVRIVREEAGEGGEVWTQRPSTLALYMPDPTKAVASVKMDRTTLDPSFEQVPPARDSALAVYDEAEFLEYFAGQGVADDSRVAKVELEWDKDRIDTATIVVTNPALAEDVTWLLRRTGVTQDRIKYKTLVVEYTEFTPEIATLEPPPPEPLTGPQY